MDSSHSIIVFVVGIIAGSFSTLVGAASLVTMPVLIFLGLPPHIAIGTNRLGFTGMPVSGWYAFHRKKMIDYKIAIPIAVAMLVGSLFGAKIVLEVKENILQYVVGGVNIALLIIIVAKHELGMEHVEKEDKNSRLFIGAFVSFFLGIYGGFYGAGVATFISYLLIMLFGQTFLESAATRKVAVLFLSVAASVVFIINGVVVYSIAIPLFAGMFTGSYVASYYSDRIGNVWIKRMFFFAVFLMTLKLLF